MLNSLRPILLSLAALGAALLLARLAQGLGTEYSSILPRLPFATLLLAVLLALVFNRSRLAQMLLLVTLVYWLMLSQAGTRGYRDLMAALAILLPINLILFSLYRERGLISASSLYRLALVLLQAGLVTWWVVRHPIGLRALAEAAWWPQWALASSPFGQLSQLLMLLALVVSLITALRDSSWQGGNYFTAAVLLTAVLHFRHGGLENIVLFSVLPVAAIVTLLLDSYSMAYLDELTGLPGRRALREHLARLEGEYSVAMLDVDHFKKFNDTYGHDIGDQVLRFVAGKMRKVGGGGKAYRYGGEEFTFVFPGKAAAAALPFLEAVREDIAGSSFSVRGQDRPKGEAEGARGRRGAEKTVSVTASLGLAAAGEGGGGGPEAVLKAADEALYRAKAGGRNCTRQ